MQWARQWYRLCAAISEYFIDFHTSSLLFIRVCSRWNFRLSFRESYRLLRLAIDRYVQCRTLATAVQYCESTCMLSAQRVYVFFGTLRLVILHVLTLLYVQLHLHTMLHSQTHCWRRCTEPDNPVYAFLSLS